MSRKIMFVMLFTITALMGVPGTLAFSSYLDTFNATYPSDIGTRIDTCELCHINPVGGGARNPYGTDFANHGHNFTAIESLDSDEEGFTNIAEIHNLTFPGNASDFPPVVTNFTPPSPVVDVVGEPSRTFTVTVNQPVNVTWLINGTEVQTGMSGANNQSTYTNTSPVEGTWNVTAIAQKADDGVAMQKWDWIVTAAVGAPNITSFAPPTPVNDTAPATREFNITVNQTVNVTWLLDGVVNKTENSVTTSIITITADGGTHNVTIVARNPYGQDMRIWVWNVAAPPAAGTPAIISWGNNKTNDTSLNIAANVSGTIRFNATANQSITTWNWFLNDINQNNNFDNFSDHFAAAGTYTVKVNATNANGTSNTVVWNVTVTPTAVTGAPNITSFTPPAPVNDTAPATRTFNITVNQTVNVTWFFDGTVNKTDNSVNMSNVTITAGAGIHNVTAAAQNPNGTDVQKWNWNVTSPLPTGAPNITSFAPVMPVVNNFVGESRTFSITFNQTVNVTWYINGTMVSSLAGVTTSSYINTSAVLGTWNVTAVAQNANGTAIHMWDWIVTTPPPSGIIKATVEIKPETLNLASNGKFTAFVTLPDGHNVADINVSTVVCEGAHAVKAKISKKNGGTLIVKFNRRDLANVPAGNAVKLTVTGELTDGTKFEGSDTIRVIGKSKSKDKDDDEDDDEDDGVKEHENNDGNHGGQDINVNQVSEDRKENQDNKNSVNQRNKDKKENQGNKNNANQGNKGKKENHGKSKR